VPGPHVCNPSGIFFFVPGVEGGGVRDGERKRTKNERKITTMRTRRRVNPNT